MRHRHARAWIGALLLFVAAGLDAQSITFSPVNPRVGQTIEISFPAEVACAPIPIVQVRPPGAGNGRIVLASAYTPCGEPSLQQLTVQVGLPLGTYVVTAYYAPGASVTVPLVVSTTGAVAGLAIQPASPLAGAPAEVAIDSVCPLALEPPRLVAEAGRTVVEIENVYEVPPPPVACRTDPLFRHTVELPALEVGPHLVRVVTKRGSVRTPEAEFVFGVSSPEGLSFLGGRFTVSARWSAPGFPESAAHGVPITDESGYFYFLGPSNVEVLVKLLDGCLVNRRHWLFLAGLTNVELTVFVYDTFSGQTEVYASPDGTAFQPVQDTASFATCPGLLAGPSSGLLAAPQ
jgi:hypothetical protein